MSIHDATSGDHVSVVAVNEPQYPLLSDEIRGDRGGYVPLNTEWTGEGSGVFGGMSFAFGTDDDGDIARCWGLLWMCVVGDGGYVLTTLVLSMIE